MLMSAERNGVSFRGAMATLATSKTPKDSLGSKKKGLVSNWNKERRAKTELLLEMASRTLQALNGWSQP